MAYPTSHNSKIEPQKPVAIVRLDDLSEAIQIAQAIVEGGIVQLEYTLSNPEAIGAITEVKRELGERAVIGAGTVLDARAAHDAIAAGAEFLVTPAFLPDVVQVGREEGITVLCGAYTPTEIIGAWRAGADFVKVFPAGRLGPAYIKDVLAPLPFLKLVPTGGINLDNCRAFLDAGAYTVAVGSSLVDERLVYAKDWAAITTLAHQFVSRCAGEE